MATVSSYVFLTAHDGLGYCMYRERECTPCVRQKRAARYVQRGFTLGRVEKDLEENVQEIRKKNCLVVDFFVQMNM